MIALRAQSIGVLVSLCVAASALAATPFRVATFQADVTVPLGHALMGGGIEPAKEILDPLYAQGIVLLGPDAPIVWLAIDWCEIRNDAYDEFRQAIANAAGTHRERVLLAAIHQHDTPVADFAAQALLDDVGLENSLCDVAFVRDCIARTAEALADALPDALPVTHYGAGAADVRGVASNRRIVLEDGTPAFHRNSSAPDPDIRAQPEGLIDPTLRILSFWNDDTPVAALSTYAVHPMSYYGRGGVSTDFVGAAREAMAIELGIPYLYFSGCSGDVVAGKYNDGAESERPKLAQRMHDGHRAAWEATTRHPLEEVELRTAKLTLPMRETEGFTEADQRAVLADPAATPFNRNLAAMGLSWRARHESEKPIDVPAVDFGKAAFVLMPAESFVEYQRHAAHIRPDSTVLVAGYGECAPGYIPSPSAIAEGFIETHTWCWVGPEAPTAMKAALSRALTAP